MDPLPIVLMMIDEVQGGTQTRRLANGWLGWESQTLRRARARGARALVALAARLTPEPITLPETRRAARPDAIA